MSPIFQDASSSRISSALPASGGKSRSFIEEPFVFTAAFSRPPLLHSAWRNWRRVASMPGSSESPVFVGHSGV
jgi:hypothetical protein